MSDYIIWWTVPVQWIQPNDRLRWLVEL